MRGMLCFKEEKRMQQEYLQIGEIVRPQGIRGEVKLRAMTEDMSRYARLESVFLKKNGQMEEKKVLKGRSYDGFAFLQLEGVNDRDAAEALRGAEVYVDRKHAIKLGADENFVCELIGLKAVDENGEAIGTLRDVLKPNTVCDVYVFDTARGELMIPALKRVVRKVDVDAGVMTLDRAALNEVAVWEDEPAERDEKVVRGGAWNSRPKNATAYIRNSYYAWQPANNVGFRVIIED